MTPQEAPAAPLKSAKELGLVTCQRCSKVWPAQTPRCGRCGHVLQSRDATSLQRVWAYLIVGFMCYLPANVYPMLETRTLAHVERSTIIGGAVDLAHHGSWGVAAIILLASVAIPIGKFIAVGYLAWSVRGRAHVSSHHRHLLYEVVEYIGRWSMIDVFVVAITAALVQLNTLASITPGIASLFFALSVIFTMLAAQVFDSRLIWDRRLPTDRPDKGPDTGPDAGSNTGSNQTAGAEQREQTKT